MHASGNGHHVPGYSGEILEPLQGRDGGLRQDRRRRESVGMGGSRGPTQQKARVGCGALQVLHCGEGKGTVSVVENHQQLWSPGHGGADARGLSGKGKIHGEAQRPDDIRTVCAAL
jgi:hypothetical protein